MKDTSTFTVSRCHSVGTAPVGLQQQNCHDHANVVPALKTWRKSNVSATVRCPNELLPKVRALIAAYRQQHQNHPDRW
jgi:hypothetical protein